MLEEAHNTIFENIVKHPSIEGSVNLLKDGTISVKFVHEPKRIHFSNFIEVLEIIECVDNIKPVE